MAETKTSGALPDIRSTSSVTGAAPGGLPPAEKATPTTPHQWTLQRLVAAIKNLNRNNPLRQNR
jgi:hypothetical protein